MITKKLKDNALELISTDGRETNLRSHVDRVQRYYPFQPNKLLPTETDPRSRKKKQKTEEASKREVRPGDLCIVVMAGRRSTSALAAGRLNTQLDVLLAVEEVHLQLPGRDDKLQGQLIACGVIIENAVVRHPLLEPGTGLLLLTQGGEDHGVEVGTVLPQLVSESA